MKKVVIYIDGSNFYFSVRNKFKCKIDIEKFCKKLSEGEELTKVNYYISPVGESNPKMYVQQQKFLNKLSRIKNLSIIFGRLEKRKRDGKVYYIEKATDVNLALDLVLDAQANVYDKAYLISNDGDFSGAVKETIKRFEKEMIYTAVGNKSSISFHLQKVSSQTIKIDQKFIQEIIIGE